MIRASAFQSKLLVWNVDLKEMKHQFICDLFINNFEWAPDSEILFCMSKNTIQVWDLLNSSLRFKINETPLLITDAIWAPDSRHILVINEFHMKLTVWSLISNTVAVIDNPKPIDSCITFSNCGKYLAVALRLKAEDFIGIYTTETWEPLLVFSTETKDFTSIHFSPTNLTISVLESYIEEAKFLFYSIDGRLLGRHSKEATFGFTTFSQATNGKYVAVGDFCGEVTILNTFYFESISSYSYPENIVSENVVIYKSLEKSYKSDCNVIEDDSLKWEIFEVIKERPISIMSLTDQPEKPKPKYTKFGIQSLQYSSDGHYVASVNGSLPKVLFIFDSIKMKFSTVIVHQHKIKKEFPIIGASWCSNRDCLILNAKEKSSILYLPEFSKEES